MANEPESLAQGATETIDIARQVGERLRDSEATIATAESITGGLLSSCLIDIPGASDYVDRSFVAYAYDAKRNMLGITREALDRHGAVSEPVAREMATRARDIADVTWGVSTTGIAGPTGGSEEKPVGTVYIGVAYAAPWGSRASESIVQRENLDGTRLEIKEQATQRALETLVDAMERLPDGH